MAIGSMFTSLAVPNYRRYFFGCLSSNIGQWMSNTAKSWLVLVELTDSNAAMLGYLTAVMFLPNMFVTPFGGLLADRFPKRNLALITQSCLCASAATLATLVISGHVRLWMVFALAFWDGLIGAVDNPTRQSFVSELVGPDRLPNAIGLNSASFNAARLLGPGLSGLVIDWFGTGYSFAVNAASFLVLIALLASMDKTAFFIGAKVTRGAGDAAGAGPRVTGSERGVRSLLAGLRYVRQRPHLVLLFSIALMMGTFAFNYAITNPLMATQAFHRGARGYGILGSVMGIGSLTGALLAAQRRRPRVRHVYVFLAIFCLTSSASALAPNFTVFTLLMVPIGFSAISITVTCNSMIQISIDAPLRGRVMALWNLCIMGLTPIVSPAIGLIGDFGGPRATVWFCTIPLIITFAVVTWHLYVRRGYRLHYADRHFWVTETPPTHDTHHRPAEEA
ncbi:MAG: MFS transporter [Propionibacteriaceae bacterium]|jgi:MFS family permease|nr:MFS transporter [Propionibacteriaceae bacterium]